MKVPCPFAVMLPAFTLAFGPALAQTADPLQPQVLPQAAVSVAGGAHLRGLDKVSGAVTDIDLATGQGGTFGRLAIEMGECRYPTDNPAADAFGHLVIRDTSDGAIVFDGWMVASSPALNALDDARYDIWLLSCQTAQAG